MLARWHYSNIPSPSSVKGPDFVENLEVESHGNVITVDFARKKRKPSAESEASAASWRQIATSRLAALSVLQNGWDGSGSVAISREAVALADRLLEVAFNDVRFAAPPNAVPCSDGAVQLEWWLTDVRLEVVVEASGVSEVWGLMRDTGLEFEATGAQGVEIFLGWAKRLTADKLVSPA